MDKCCATCKWCQTDPFTAEMVCGNYESERCCDQVGEDYSCDEWKMDVYVPYYMEDV